jgi:hypothetical protein
MERKHYSAPVADKVATLFSYPRGDVVIVCRDRTPVINSSSFSMSLTGCGDLADFYVSFHHLLHGLNTYVLHSIWISAFEHALSRVSDV